MNEKLGEHPCVGQQPQNDRAIELKPSLTRRHVLRAAAIGLAAAGLGTTAEAAMAASTKVKACKTSAVPVRGLKTFKVKGQTVLITQPRKGTFRVFSSVCTHAGAVVTGLSGTNLVCTAHGSKFNTSTGKPTAGPAMTPLKKYAVSVKNGFLYITV